MLSELKLSYVTIIMAIVLRFNFNCLLELNLRAIEYSCKYIDML